MHLLTLTLNLLVPLFASAQNSSCTTVVGDNYTDFCCDCLKWGIVGPCENPISIGNASDCGTQVTNGWGCCVEKDPVDPQNPDWTCGPPEAFPPGLSSGEFWAGFTKWFGMIGRGAQGQWLPLGK